MIIENYLLSDHVFYLMTALTAFEEYYVFHMLSVWKHVDRLHSCHPVGGIEQAEVASLCGRVATHIDNARGCCKEYCIDYILMHTGTWRVGDDDVGPAVLAYEVGGEYVFHVAGIEQCVVDTVDFRVYACIIYSLGHIFYADYLTGLAAHEVGYGACACVEVVYQFRTGEPCKVASHAVKGVSLLGVGLVETFGTYLELERLHLLVYEVGSAECVHLLVAECVVTLMIVNP